MPSKRWLLTFGTAAGLVLSALESTTAQMLPPALGWHEIPETKLARVCPPNGFGGSSYAFSDNCRYVTEAWNSAVFDQGRNRLIVWGGGHADYLGNEIYALELNTLSVRRLTDPGLPVTTNGCEESVQNGSQANARHTYDGIAYLDHVDRMFVFGGSLSRCGFLGRGTWTFSFATGTWEKHKPSGPIPRAVPGVVTGYDPNSRLVFRHDDTDLYSYDVDKDRYRRLDGGSPIDYHMTGVIDPVRRKFVIVGAGHVYVSASDPGSGTRGRRSARPAARRSSTASTPVWPTTRSRTGSWPGMVAIRSYSLNLDTRAWVPTTYPGGPGNALENGTFKRWSYSPASGVFVLVNSMHGNAWAFRLSPAGARPVSPAPPKP